ncbi:MAG: ATP-binding cassette domain-containing protein [Cellvibrionaceae bacterium]
MPLLRLTDIHLAYGTHVLFDDVNITIGKNQRFGLLGRNGAGKSTFMKLLTGQIKADSGEYWLRPNSRVAYLDQELPSADDISMFDFVAQGLGDTGKLLQEFHRLSHSDFSDSEMKQLEIVQQKIEAADGWSFQQRIDSTLTQLGLSPDVKISSLSGGWRRRAALAQALVSEPEILLLDEPTNHLDIPTINWLESMLKEFRGTIVVITHDRNFLQQIATDILEIDRGTLRSWHGDYHGFLQMRDQQLAAEEKLNSEFDKKLAREEVWIRQGIKARRTRNEGRVRALKEMRSERQQRRNQQGQATMTLEKADASGKIVVEAEGISKSYDGKTVVPNFSTKIIRGDRIGIIGANGAGKTTLLKMLLGEIKPDTGKINVGTKLEVAYFDQLRSQLDQEKTVIDNIAEGREFIEINGKSKHVISYLQDFLFPPERTRQPVKALSGGEQNRLILAYLFSKPANLLVLDEPTNDLDMETLELLEEILLSFTGTLLLVSHDRAFIDNVVTNVIVFEGDGSLNEYVGSYQDWVDRGGQLLDQSSKTKGKKPPSNKESDPVTQENNKPAAKKLSYKMQRELEQLPLQIEEAEAAMKRLEEKTLEKDFYTQDKKLVSDTLQEMTDMQNKLTKYYERWEEIENET